MMSAEALKAEHTLAGLLHGFDDVNIRQDLVVSGIALDSRKVQAGDVFLAVAGTQTHGLQHARQAIAVAKEAGAADRAAFHLKAAEDYLESAEQALNDRAYSEARRDAKQAKMKALDALKASETTNN